jgi:hypothetical protein
LKNKWRFWSSWLGQGHRKYRKLSAGVIPQTRKWKELGHTLENIPVSSIYASST